MTSRFSLKADVKKEMAFNETKPNTAKKDDSLSFEQLEEMRKSLISNISHELRTPLTAMQGFLQAILDGTVSKEEQENYLDIVLQETRRLGSVVNSLLTLSRIESGKHILVKKAFNINSVIKNAALFYGHRIEAKLINIDFATADTEMVVFADKNQIGQVLINLIDNAINFSPPNSLITVKITAVDAQKLYVSVIDQGSGIGQAVLPHIWDSFYTSGGPDGKGSGTGLGLSIAKRILTEHGEDITVESTPGEGSNFTFSLTLYDENLHKID